MEAEGSTSSVLQQREANPSPVEREEKTTYTNEEDDGAYQPDDSFRELLSLFKQVGATYSTDKAKKDSAYVGASASNAFQQRQANPSPIEQDNVAAYTSEEEDNGAYYVPLSSTPD